MGSQYHLDVPRTPPRHSANVEPSSSTRSPPRSTGTEGYLTSSSPYPPISQARRQPPSTPPRQLSSNYRPRTPSTLARAINTTLPSSPPTGHSADFSSPSRHHSRYNGESVELTPLRQSRLVHSNESPFHDRNSVVQEEEDPFEYHSPPGRFRATFDYPFTESEQRQRGGEMEELTFGEELQTNQARPVSEYRRSLYSPQTPISISTLQDHPDLMAAPIDDPVGGGGGDPTERPRRLPDPVRPRFRGLFALSTKRDNLINLLPGIIFAIGGSLIQPYMSLIIGEAFAVFSAYPADIDIATTEMDIRLSIGVKQTSLKLAIAGLVAMLVNYIKGALWIRHGERVVSRLRQKVFDGVQAKNMEWFDLGMGINGDEEDEDGNKIEAVGAGGLMAKFTKETDEVRLATSTAMGNLIQYTFTFIFCIALAMWKGAILALVTLSTIPIVVGVQIVTQVFLGPMLEQERRAFAEASTNVERATSAITTVKAHNAESTESKRFEPISTRAQNSLVRQAIVWAISYSLSETLLLSTFVIGFWYGAKVVREGKSSAGDVMTVFWAALLAATYLQMAVPQLMLITKGKMSMASLQTVIKDLPDRPLSGGNPFSPVSTPVTATFGSKARARPTSTMRMIRPTRCNGEYNFQNVSFYYPSRPEQWVLKDVTLFLPPGETTFIVGGSGSGKSTVVQLLLRMYTPVGGEITLDDQSIAYLDNEYTKEHIAAVQQGCILFDMSIHDNVAMGLAGAGAGSGIAKRPSDVTRREVVEACKMAMIHDFISALPEGYETKLGTGGNSLSGGQRQRLAIARARIRDPTVLILDEATSALDATSRVVVFEAMKRWRKNRTTIVITHDLSQIVSDDFVYVMKDGVVAEQGFRSDLMAKGHMYGVFAGLAAEQAIQPVPEKHEEYVEYEEHLDEGDIDRSIFANALGRPNSYYGAGGGGIGPDLRPPSVAYLGLLDEYSKGSGSRFSVAEDDRNSFRPMSIAQKRLSWAPQDLALTRPGASRMSSFNSRPSYEGTPPAISIRRPSYDSHSPYIRPGEKELRPVSTLSYRHNASRSSQFVVGDAKDLEITIDSPTTMTVAEPVKQKTQSVFKILATHSPRLPSKTLLLLGIIASIGHGVCTPFWSNYLSNLMNIVGQGGTSPTLTKNALIVLGLAISQGISDLIQDWTLFSLSAKWTAQLRVQTFEKVISQDKAFFDDSANAPSALMQIIIKDIDDMRNLVAQVIGKFIVFVVMVGMGITWAMIVQWRMTLIGLAVGPFLAVVVLLNELLIGRAEVRNKTKREAVAKTFYESIANIRGIRAMALDSTFRDKFRLDADLARYLGQRDAWMIAVGAAISAAMPLMLQAMMNWAGMELMLLGYMNYAEMLKVYNLILFSLTFGTALLDFIPQMTKAKVAASDFNRLYNLSLATAETEGDLRYPITGNVTFSNVAFAYPTRPDVPIFDNLSFSLRSGECVAIVGPSGSGKSTVAAILQRLYQPSSGEIRFDKHSLASVDVKWLRNHVAVVSQSANLFDASVTENIAYGSETVPMEEIHRAARAANIHDFIVSLPQGYDTNLGENASLISGGQAQRLQIARALVRRSNILILDEATSALDVDNARAILDTIVKIKESRTTVFITHSVEAMKRCDRIICLGDGKVAEDGTFEELVARGGVFAQLMQTGEWE